MPENTGLWDHIRRQTYRAVCKLARKDVLVQAVFVYKHAAFARRLCRARFETNEAFRSDNEVVLQVYTHRKSTTS